MRCARCHTGELLHPGTLSPSRTAALRRALGGARAAALAELLELLRGDLCVECLIRDPVRGPRYRAARRRAFPWEERVQRGQRYLRATAGRALDLADGLLDRLRRRRRT